MQPNKHMNHDVQGIFHALINHFPPSIDENFQHFEFGMHASLKLSSGAWKFREYLILHDTVEGDVIYFTMMKWRKLMKLKGIIYFAAIC